MQGIQDKEIIFHVFPTISMGWKVLMVLGCIKQMTLLLWEAPWPSFFLLKLGIQKLPMSQHMTCNFNFDGG
jgi:hypothetical protein